MFVPTLTLKNLSIMKTFVQKFQWALILLCSLYFMGHLFAALINANV